MQLVLFGLRHHLLRLRFNQLLRELQLEIGLLLLQNLHLLIVLSPPLTHQNGVDLLNLIQVVELVRAELLPEQARLPNLLPLLFKVRRIESPHKHADFRLSVEALFEHDPHHPERNSRVRHDPVVVRGHEVHRLDVQLEVDPQQLRVQLRRLLQLLALLLLLRPFLLVPELLLLVRNCPLLVQLVLLDDPLVPVVVRDVPEQNLHYQQVVHVRHPNYYRRNHRPYF